jgi:hypothetical protein
MQKQRKKEEKLKIRALKRKKGEVTKGKKKNSAS